MSLKIHGAKVPKGWVEKRLASLIDISHGYAFKGADFKTSNDTEKPIILTPGNYSENCELYFTSKNTKRLTENDPPKDYLFSMGDLTVVMTDLSSKMKILGKPAFISFPNILHNQRIGRILFKDESINPRYLFYFLQTKVIVDKIKETATGTMVRHTAPKRILENKILLPPLSKQKQIVAILDEVFEGIDRAIANTEKNLTNARELFESYLNEIFIQKGDGWIEKRLSEIAGKISTGPFGSILHKSDYVVNGIPIVNPANIDGDEIIPNFNKTIDQDMAKKLQSYILKKDDVVVGRRGEIGRCAVVKEEQSGWLCGSGSFFIKPFENVDSVFLAHLIRSATYRSKLEALSAGATMLNLSNQSLSDLVIGMPSSLEEQNQITYKLDDLKAETQRLESIYRQKLAALNELKQSILQKAFTGELTADTYNLMTKAAEGSISA